MAASSSSAKTPSPSVEVPTAYKNAAEAIVLYYPRLQALETLVSDGPKDVEFIQAFENYQKAHALFAEDRVSKALAILYDKAEAERREITDTEIASTATDSPRDPALDRKASADTCQKQLDEITTAVAMLKEILSKMEERRQGDLISFLDEQDLSIQALSLVPQRLAEHQSKAFAKDENDLTEYKRLQDTTDVEIREKAKEGMLKRIRRGNPYRKEELEAEAQSAWQTHLQKRDEMRRAYQHASIEVGKWDIRMKAVQELIEERFRLEAKGSLATLQDRVRKLALRGKNGGEDLGQGNSKDVSEKHSEENHEDMEDNNRKQDPRSTRTKRGMKSKRSRPELTG